jgi:hypothetical protein
MFDVCYICVLVVGFLQQIKYMLHLCVGSWIFTLYFELNITSSCGLHCLQKIEAIFCVEAEGLQFMLLSLSPKDGRD